MGNTITLPEEVIEPIQPVESVQPAVTVEPVKKSWDEKIPMIMFVVTICLFLASPFLSKNLWGIAAVTSILFYITLVIGGIVNYNKGGKSLLRVALAFFVTVLLVGFGTCVINVFRW